MGISHHLRMADDDLRETLLDIERRGWDSLCAGMGGDFYGDLMTAEAVMVLANGAVMNRDAVVRSLEQAPPWRTYEISDARVIPCSRDSATLVYVGTAYRESDEPAFVGVMSSVYLREGDEWHLALYQQTPIPDAG
jgi:uncharacterized protein DUF4440